MKHLYFIVMLHEVACLSARGAAVSESTFAGGPTGCACEVALSALPRNYMVFGHAHTKQACRARAAPSSASEAPRSKEAPGWLPSILKEMGRPQTQNRSEGSARAKNSTSLALPAAGLPTTEAMEHCPH